MRELIERLEALLEMSALKMQRVVIDDSEKGELHYDVNKLYRHAKEKKLKIHEIPIKKLKHELRRFKTRTGTRKFKKIVKKAKMYPIITMRWGGKHHILDGRHRLIKAHARGDTHIRGYAIPYSRMPKSALVKRGALKKW